MLTTIRLDRRASPVRLGATPIETTAEGFRVYEGCAVYGDVVYEYPEFGRNEYVPASESMSPEAVATLVGKPFTIHHPDDLLTADDPDGLKEHVEGTVRAASVDRTKSPPELRVEVVVWTKPAQEAIESGDVVELSPGYRCEEDDAPAGAVGPGGIPYQRIQRRRQYNHLSGVLRARGVTPDGRRARLDEAAAYPHADALQESPTMLIAPTANDATANAPADQSGAPHPLTIAPLVEDRKDAEGEAPPASPAADPLADPAAMMAEVFSAEAAEVLKSLPPEDLKMLAALVAQRKGEEAEHEVEAAAKAAGLPMPEDAAVEVEVKPEGEGGEEEAEAEAEVEADAKAKPPAAAEAMDMPAMIKDLCDQMAALKADLAAMKAKPKTDAAQSASKPAATKIDAAAIRAEVEKSVRAEVEFIEAAKAKGIRCDSLATAAAGIVAEVKEHAPALASMADAAAAKVATDASARADLLALQAHADGIRENARRDGLLGRQMDAVRFALDADDAYRRDRTAGADNGPAYIDPTPLKSSKGGK